MRSSRTAGFALVVVAILSAAFWWLDFRAAQAQTNVESQLTAISGGSAEGNLDPKGSNLGVYVAGEGVLAEALGAGLLSELQTELAFSQVSLLASLPEDASQPVLVAEVSETDLFWSPVYGRTRLEIDVAYASDGELAWRGKTPVEITGEKPLLRLEGTYALSDETKGLVSRHSYLRALGEEAADKIAASFANTVRAHLQSVSASR